MEKILDRVQAISDRLVELEALLDQPDVSDGDIYMILAEAKSLDVQLAFLKDTHEEVQRGTIRINKCNDM